MYFPSFLRADPYAQNIFSSGGMSTESKDKVIPDFYPTTHFLQKSTILSELTKYISIFSLSAAVPLRIFLVDSMPASFEIQPLYLSLNPLPRLCFFYFPDSYSVG